MTVRQGLLFAAACCISITPLPARATEAIPLDSLGIVVEGGSRDFLYSNTLTAHFYGATSAEHGVGWMGLTVGGKKALDDYLLRVNGLPLSRDSILRAIVFPDRLVRYYPGGIIEEMGMTDSTAALWIVVRAREAVTIDLVPLFASGRGEADFTVRVAERSASIARVTRAGATPALWLTASGTGFTARRDPFRRGGMYSPVVLHGGAEKTHTMLLLATSTEGEGRDVPAVVARLSELRAARRVRMEELLRRAMVTTADRRFDRALAWSVISLDALTMHQGSPGVYAGLPWFNNYWGRDTFISLPGAALVTGRFPLARAILRAFAGHQERDPSSPNFGRIPNFYSPDGAAYNTADATPRFVMMAREYIDRSGDTSFRTEIFPVVARSIEGTIARHTDSLGFLTHGDAETWMDAAGPSGPWSPRGNRANDVQALWVQQLEAGAWLASAMGETATADTWTLRAQSLRSAFHRYFVKEGVVTDHLNPDGSRDKQLRPNVLFAAPVLDRPTRLRNVAVVATRLTYAHGVASLSQDDPSFHPHHEHPPFYPKDAAYHNGTVWTWLQGPLISELCSFGHEAEAWQLTRNAVHEILDRGAVGTQSELLDAVPHPGEREPRLSGTVSQAWNLAEFVRCWYDDYLGVRYSALDRRLLIAPHLPAGLGSVATRFPLGAGTGVLTFSMSRGGTSVDLLSEPGADSTGVELTLPSSRGIVRCRVALPAHSHLQLVVSDGGVNASIDGKGVPLEMTGPEHPGSPPREKPFVFAVPTIRPGLRSLSGPQYPLLDHGIISRRNPNATLLVRASDPQGDDQGVDTIAGRHVAYTYPRDPLFLPGSFDLLSFSVAHDSAFAYFVLKFRALSNPGWHPEYGFQLTEAAIAIDTDGHPGKGARDIPANAHFQLPAERAYERLILVGGGVQVEDAGGKVLVAYVPSPADAQSPFGDVASATIRFALPLKFLGRPDKTWKFTILAGAQDDHGGAGIGEFRSVSREASDWNGGGRVDPGGSNIYDILTIP